MDEHQFTKIWTIGHSTRTFEEFTALLKSFQIEVVADVRSFPGSRRYPHFNKEAMEVSLPQNGIKYIHFKDLGGRRKARPDSVNTAWRNDAFKGYADYMETEVFMESLERLRKIAVQQRTAYMCSEAVWWRCHRALISDYLKFHGWTVIHIMGVNKGDEHPYTTPVRIAGDQLLYDKQ